MRGMSSHPASGSLKTLVPSLERLAHTLWQTLGPLAGHSSGSTETYASPRTRVSTRQTWHWSSGTVEEERSLTPGYLHLAPGDTFAGAGIWHPDPRPSTGSVGRSCPGPRLGDRSRRVG